MAEIWTNEHASWRVMARFYWGLIMNVFTNLRMCVAFNSQNARKHNHTTKVSIMMYNRVLQHILMLARNHIFNELSDITIYLTIKDGIRKNRKNYFTQIFSSHFFIVRRQAWIRSALKCHQEIPAEVKEKKHSTKYTIHSTFITPRDSIWYSCVALFICQCYM